MEEKEEVHDKALAPRVTETAKAQICGGLEVQHPVISSSLEAEAESPWGCAVCGGPIPPGPSADQTLLSCSVEPWPAVLQVPEVMPVLS